MSAAISNIVSLLIQSVLIPLAIATGICVAVVLHWKQQGIRGGQLTTRKNFLFLGVMGVTGLLIIVLLGRAFGG